MIKVNVNYNLIPTGLNYKKPNVKSILREAHYKKCCYCETNNIKGDIEHFRPKVSYPWLVNVYENLLFACHDCNQKKSSKLPVENINATEPDNVSICNEKETLIMINPADCIENELEIFFDRNGKINSRNDKMLKTIEVCDLNRADLIEKRIEVYKEFEKEIIVAKRFENNAGTINHIKLELIKPLRNDNFLSYKAFRKHIVRNFLSDLL
jgi:uncharacterized protein (TIGR02646 family)